MGNKTLRNYFQCIALLSRLGNCSSTNKPSSAERQFVCKETEHLWESWLQGLNSVLNYFSTDVFLRLYSRDPQVENH